MIFSPKQLANRFGQFHYHHASLYKLERLVRYTREGRPLPMPSYLFVEPTNICNYSCPKCPQSTGLGRPPATMEIDLFRDLIAQLKPHKPCVTLHHSGEPMLHPRIFDMIRIAREAGLHTILVTNASLLHKEDFRVTREGPDAITFSVDGASPGSYEPAHGGAPWETIKSNIEEFFKRRGPESPTQIAQIAMVKDSQKPEEIQELMDFSRKFPFTIAFTKPAFKWPNGKGVSPIPEFSPGHFVYPCGHPWLSPAILADGAVVPCCLDAHMLYPAGNIKEKTFIEIFNGQRLELLRRHLLDLEGTPPLPLCDSCFIKRLAVPMSARNKIIFRTMPIWKRFFRSLPTPLEVLE